MITKLIEDIIHFARRQKSRMNGYGKIHNEHRAFKTGLAELNDFIHDLNKRSTKFSVESGFENEKYSNRILSKSS